LASAADPTWTKSTLAKSSTSARICWIAVTWADVSWVKGTEPAV